MLILMIFIALASFIVGFVILANKSLPSIIKIPLVILCAIIFIVSLFLNIVMLDGRRVGRGADEFLRNMVENSKINAFPPVSNETTLDQKEQFFELIRAFPKCDYRIIYIDYFAGAWNYEIHFDNGQSYYIWIYALGTFMTLFAHAEYCLDYIEELKGED